MSISTALASGLVGPDNNDDLLMPGRARPRVAEKDLEEVRHQSSNSALDGSNSFPLLDLEADTAPT